MFFMCVFFMCMDRIGEEGDRQLLINTKYLHSQVSHGRILVLFSRVGIHRFSERSQTQVRLSDSSQQFFPPQQTISQNRQLFFYPVEERSSLGYPAPPPHRNVAKLRPMRSDKPFAASDQIDPAGGGRGNISKRCGVSPVFYSARL